MSVLGLVADWRERADEDERYLNRAHASEIHDVYASIRINREHADALEVVYPMLRQQVAEEIALALEAEARRHSVPTAAMVLDAVAAPLARQIGGL